MNEHATRAIRASATAARWITLAAQPQLTTPVSAARASSLRIGFTDREWNRLAFLRWSYQHGRLTEWADG